ncbi:quinone-dependent dihydroorotate dehydrogenase [Marinimicrococcus flavescens]|uniref:Dihydroorotate dehydrogenase (quinone) n=1 Tax=Marinimicrococcus flavescens TaxID=3031815 RepID=A0AAP3XPI9_9PROT|nr:quinone-dependent dihydroorotate dehydrogenase [Marinimicrococcus flavescens]
MVAAALLRLLPPEAAHRAAIRLLPLVPLPALAAPERLRTRLAGLDLPHPVGLAAGFDKNAEAVAPLLRLGFAFVEVGTVTPRPQAGNPKPRLFRLTGDGAVINRMGFNNDGLDAVAARLAARPKSGIVGANIGMNRDAADPALDYLAGLERLHPLADYLVVNVSSPNTPGLRALQKAESLARLLEALVRRRGELVAAGAAPKPVFLKIAPDLEAADEAAIAEVALASGIDGLIVSNTTTARPATLRSARRSEAGGLSGRPLMAPSTALLGRMAQLLGGRLPLIGVGGIASAEDAYAKIRAGATAVQVYTGMVQEGPFLVRRIVRGLEALLDRDGHADISAAVGADLRGERAA